MLCFLGQRQVIALLFMHCYRQMMRAGLNRQMTSIPTDGTSKAIQAVILILFKIFFYIALNSQMWLYKAIHLGLGCSVQRNS